MKGENTNEYLRSISYSWNPCITMAGSVLAIPELRDAIACKAKAIKETIKNKAKKGSR